MDVYYVVKTTAEPAHEPQHRVASRLYEIKAQAEIELERLSAADAGGEYSIWKASTYIEPARWAYDVVLADGTVHRRAPD